MKSNKKQPQRYVRAWPRAAVSHFVPKKKRKGPYPPHLRKLELLDDPGIYVLYAADGSVYYVGSGVGLGGRILTHVKPNSRYSSWTHVSAFVINDALRRRQIESILIAALPTAKNSARYMRPYKLPVRAYEE